jgi:hypothetical protein
MFENFFCKELTTELIQVFDIFKKEEITILDRTHNIPTLLELSQNTTTICR